MGANLNEFFNQNIDKKLEDYSKNSFVISNTYGNDEQSNKFSEFVNIATNFSQSSLVDKLQEIPILVESIKGLFQSIFEETKEYSDMKEELDKIISYFNDMVEKVQHNANLIIPILESAKKQLEVVEDVMNLSQTNGQNIPMNEIDKKDINTALYKMQGGIGRLMCFSKSAVAECEKANTPIKNLLDHVESKKKVIKNRLEISDFFMGLSLPASVLAGGGGTVALASSSFLGGAGVIIISGTAFPPVGAVVGACLLGAAMSLSVIYLVKKFWGKRQLNALKYLEKMFESLVQLNSNSTKFMSCMTDLEEKANVTKEHLNCIQSCLESERQRRINHDACSKAIQSTTVMIESLKRISDIELSKITNKNLPSITMK